MKDLIIAEKVDPAIVFSKGGASSILDKIKEEVAKFTPDMSTAKGRSEIKSMANRVARSKTYLDDLGKELASEWTKKVNVVNAERRLIRDTLDNLKAEVRNPVTEWENKEKARVEKHETNVTRLKEFASLQLESSEEVKYQIKELDALWKSVTDWEEFSDRASMNYTNAANHLSGLHYKVQEREKEQAELARLRKLEEGRLQKEREATIAKEAAEKARQEERERAVREKAEAEKKAKEASEKAEREKQQAIEAERQKQLAFQRKIEEEKRQEQARLAKEKADQEKREADLEHRKKINNEAMQALMNLASVSEDTAKTVVKLIASGQVPNIGIRY